jgi:hypothetical protein
LQSPPQAKNGYIVIRLDQVQDFSCRVTFADDGFQSKACNAVGAVRISVEQLLRLLLRFRLHDVGHAEPLNFAGEGLDDSQQDYRGADTRGAAARVVNRLLAIQHVIHEDKKILDCGRLRSSVGCGGSAWLAPHRTAPHALSPLPVSAMVFRRTIGSFGDRGGSCPARSTAGQGGSSLAVQPISGSMNWGERGSKRSFQSRVRALPEVIADRAGL